MECWEIGLVLYIIMIFPTAFLANFCKIEDENMFGWGFFVGLFWPISLWAVVINAVSNVDDLKFKLLKSEIELGRRSREYDLMHKQSEKYRSERDRAVANLRTAEEKLRKFTEILNGDQE